MNDLTERKVYTSGVLAIDTINGTAEFRDDFGDTLLRITHLPKPIPDNIMIDLVAIVNLTSYNSVSKGNKHDIR